MKDKQYEYLKKCFLNKLQTKTKAKKAQYYNVGINDCVSTLALHHNLSPYYNDFSFTKGEYDDLQTKLSRRLKTEYSNPADYYNQAVLACKSKLHEVAKNANII